jgi:hypothetical protein
LNYEAQGFEKPATDFRRYSAAIVAHTDNEMFGGRGSGQLDYDLPSGYSPACPDGVSHDVDQTPAHRRLIDANFAGFHVRFEQQRDARFRRAFLM